jgi:exopolysaccharide biosynthesis polyprenyl glycosylphosphotransferase
MGENKETQGMMRRKSDILLFLFPITWDAILVFLSFPAAYWIRFYSGLLPTTKGIPHLHPYMLISVFAMMVWVTVFYLLGVYDTKNVYPFIDEAYDVVKGIIVSTLIILAPVFFYRAFTFSRIVMLLGCVLGGVLVITGKILLRGFRLFLYKKGMGVRNACIVGTGNRAEEVLSRFRKNAMIGYRLVGQVIEKEEKGAQDIPVLGNPFQIREIVRKEKINMLLLTFPLSHHKETAKILLRCDGLPVDIRFVPDPYELLTSRIGYYELNGFSLLGIKEFPLTYWNAILKRAFDVVISGLLIILFSPLILLISTIIKLTSEGPLFYRQKRVGKDGALFDIIKFRSMRIDAEEQTGPVFASESDSRTTEIGKILRKWSIDELPQLLNVLEGNMSLVGPRPERPEFVERFGEEIFRYVERHKVKPGITGWAQVNGLRGDTSIKERAKYDLYYIENWSIGFDIKVLLRTLNAITAGENAY